MSKKNKGGDAAKAAAAKTVADKKVETAKADNTAKESANVEETQQVAADAATEKEKKEAAKTTAPAQTSTQKEKKEEKKEEKKPTQQTAKPKKDKTPTVIAEEVTEGLSKTLGTGGIPAGVAIGSNRSSADAKAMLVFVGHERFTKNEEFKNQYPEAYANTVRTIDAVWLLGMLDIQNEFAERAAAGEFICKVPADQVFRLADVAESLGIELATPKALPETTDGKQLAIDFANAKVPEELKEDKKAAAPEPPSLDPKDVKTHDELVTVLEYLMRKERNIAVNIVNTVEWYRVYCMGKEDNADKKIELDNRSVAEWIEEIFKIIKNVPSMNGLGRTVYLYTASQGSPVSAHALLHAHMSPCGWSEEQIASTLKVLLQENFRYKLASDSVDKDGNPKESTLRATDDKALQAVIGNIGSKYIDDLFNILATGITATEASEKNAQEEALSLAKKQYELVSQNYFSGEKKPTKDEVRMKIGQIINLYRDPMDRLAEYEVGMIAPREGEYPDNKTSKEKKS